MALDKVLKIYDENGNQVDYDILASDVKFLPDGKDLPTKLTEMEDAIEDAAEGGGYTPPQGGIPKTDLAPSVQTSLGLADTALQEADKIQLQAAINAVQTALNNLMNGKNVTDSIDTFNEVVTFLNGIDTDDPTLANQLLALNNAITGLQTALAGKISGIKANGASTTLPVDQNGIVELPPAGSTISPATAAPSMDGTANVGSSAKYAREDHVHPHDTTKLSKSDVSVETQGDGTVDINIKDDTYTINLNHTHENMAKIVKCTEATLPQTLADDTIYVQVDSANPPTEIEKLYLFGLEFTGGGGIPDTDPKLTSPRSGFFFDFNGQSTATLLVKGKNLTGALSLTATGDFTITDGNGNSVSSISPVDGIVDVQLTLTKGSNFVGGTLVVSSSELENSVSVQIVDLTEIQDLTGVKFTGTQWLETDYKANPNTEFVLLCRFEENQTTDTQDGMNRRNWILGGNDAGGCYELYHASPTNSQSKYNFIISLNTLSSSANINNINSMLANPFEIRYDKTQNKLFAGTYSTKVSAKTGTNTSNLRICGRLTNGDDICYSRFDITIYEFTISENGSPVRHYVPQKRYGVVGLYDTVTGSFISSKTNDALVEIS